jgi:hypothetical protein
MPDLLHALPHTDLAFLRIVARLWGLELASPEPGEAAAELADQLADAELIEEMLATLPDDSRAALEVLSAEGGRTPWPGFVRRFGEVREMGPGRREREQPHLRPSSAAETLYYRALLARAFFETPAGPQEFAYIPDEFLLFIQPAELNPEADRGKKQGEKTEEPASAAPGQSSAAACAVLGRAASPGERAFPMPASDRILDDATTLLAALRMGIEPGEFGVQVDVLMDLLVAAKLIEATGQKGEVSLLPGAVKDFLEPPRGAAMAMLEGAWRSSETFDELRQLPDLIFEGEWSNQPLATRQFLLTLLDAVPDVQWWSLAAFVRGVKAQYPDFQRPAGNFDVWLVRRRSDGQPLRGFANWDAVDGALVRYLITGPLFWLARVDLAAPEVGGPFTAFRVRSKVDISDLPSPTLGEDGKLTVASNGRISVPRSAPRAARYQIARFCEWDAARPDEYRYRATVSSLKAAAEQGLKASHLLSLLAKHSGGQVPPAFIKALQRWETQGTEARLENVTVLRVSRPEVLAELKASPAARFLGEQLGPTAIVIRTGAGPKVLAALAELGLLADVVIA